ncbi:MAG TPA: hypothetical protein VK820_10240 [Steroidobacteraceae bacterium]|nr:hypothetical protein [Steroidobacteraceae bacterium]
MTHEEHRELQVLADAEAPPALGRCYSFEKEPELAATARRLGREPVPRLIDVAEKPISGGSAIYLIKIRESGKARLRYLRLKLAEEQR